jgi:hypothetical protein
MDNYWDWAVLQDEDTQWQQQHEDDEKTWWAEQEKKKQKELKKGVDRSKQL